MAERKLTMSRAMVEAIEHEMNRDPSVFDHADDLILASGTRRHLGFGHGAHYCIGADLARVELEIAISKTGMSTVWSAETGSGTVRLAPVGSRPSTIRTRDSAPGWTRRTISLGRRTAPSTIQRVVSATGLRASR